MMCNLSHTCCNNNILWLVTTLQGYILLISPRKPPSFPISLPFSHPIIHFSLARSSLHYTIRLSLCMFELLCIEVSSTFLRYFVVYANRHYCSSVAVPLLQSLLLLSSSRVYKLEQVPCSGLIPFGSFPWLRWLTVWFELGPETGP
jgi:hypothetical protein